MQSVLHSRRDEITHLGCADLLHALCHYINRPVALGDYALNSRLNRICLLIKVKRAEIGTEELPTRSIKISDLSKDTILIMCLYYRAIIFIKWIIRK